MLLPCVLYALATCLCVALCVTSDPSASSELFHGRTAQPAPISQGKGGSEQRRTGSELVLDDTQGQFWLAVGDVLPIQPALLSTALPNQVTSSAKVAKLLPSSTITEIPSPTPIIEALSIVGGGAAASRVTEPPFLAEQLRRGAPGNATATARPPTTIRETTTVYVETDGCTGTPAPTSTMARHSIPISDAGQKGGIAGGTVGAVLIVALLTIFCYRRARRRQRTRKGFLGLSDSSSASDDAERGEVAHGGLFGSENKTASAAESFVTDVPQPPDPAIVTIPEEESTSEQVPICFRPSRRLISRYPSLPATLTPRASIRLSDYLNPVIRDSVLLPRPLRRAGARATLGRSQSWQAGSPPRKLPSGGASRSRSTTVTSSSVYSSDATFDFAEYVTVGARTSRASGTTDASGLRSTLAHFPRPPPYTFSRGDGRGLGTTWRESFVFSTPEDEVLLAFPRLARQIEEYLV